MNATTYPSANNPGGTTTMPCRPVFVFEWCCHGCKQTLWQADRGLPAGWSDQHVARLGPYAKQLDLCPKCAIDPSRVIRAWQSRFSSYAPVSSPVAGVPATPSYASLQR